MSDAFQRLEDQITHAMRRNAQARRRRSFPRLRVALVTAMLVLGAGAAAVAALTGSDGPVVKPRSAQLDIAAHFGVFRRAATDADVVRTRSGSADPGVVGATRLVLAQRNDRLYATDDGAGRICLLLQSTERAAHTCTAQDQAIAGDLPPSLTIRDRAGSTTYLLLPDGVSSVRATTRDGATWTVQPQDNAVALPLDTDDVSWITADGRPHSLSHLVPAVPQGVAPAG